MEHLSSCGGRFHCSPCCCGSLGCSNCRDKFCIAIVAVVTTPCFTLFNSNIQSLCCHCYVCAQARLVSATIMGILKGKNSQVKQESVCIFFNSWKLRCFNLWFQKWNPCASKNSRVEWSEVEEEGGEEIKLGMGGGGSGILSENDAIHTIAPISFKTNFTMKIVQGFRANKLELVKCLHRAF